MFPNQVCRVTLWPWEPRDHCPITVSSGEDYLIFGRQAYAEKHLADGSIEALGGWGSCQQVCEKTETLPSTPDSPCRTFLEPGYSHTLTSPQFGSGDQSGLGLANLVAFVTSPQSLRGWQRVFGNRRCTLPAAFPAFSSSTPLQDPLLHNIFNPHSLKPQRRPSCRPQLATWTPSPILHPSWWRDAQRAAEKGEGRFPLLTGQRSCDETPG